MNLRLIFVFVVAYSQLTIPLHEEGIHHHSLRRHHLQQSYPLKTNFASFLLKLYVNGLEYRVAMDTGSANFYINGHGMEGEPNIKFRCDECLKKNEKYENGYLDGMIDSYLVEANVTLGNHTFRQHILVGYHTNASSYRSKAGIVGLSFQQLTSYPHDNFISTLIRNKIINKYMYGLQLNFRKPNNSYIIFGGIDKRFIKEGEDIHYVNLEHNSTQLILPISSIAIGQSELPLQNAIIDSGNTCVSYPQQYAQMILSEFNTESNQCSFFKERNTKMFKIMKCRITNFFQLPELQFKFQNATFSLGKQYYLRRCIEHRHYFNCRTYIEYSIGVRQLILGDAFLQSYYSVFDLEGRRIGFARNRDQASLKELLRHTE